MKNKSIFFTSTKLSFWSLPEALVPQIFKYLSSEELLDVFMMQPSKSLDAAKIEELSRQALIVLVSRYATEGDLLNQRRGFLLCPSAVFLKKDPRYEDKVEIMTKALYSAMQHVKGNYSYKIDALFYLAAINGNPVDIMNFRSNIEDLLDSAETSYQDNLTEDVALLLPFFNEDSLARLDKLHWESTYTIMFHLQYDQLHHQEILVSSTSLAVNLFSTDEIKGLQALLIRPEHNHIKNILSKEKTMERTFKPEEVKEIKGVLEAAKKIELSAKVVPYAQSRKERKCSECLNVLNSYPLEDYPLELLWVLAWQLESVEQFF